MSGTFLDDLKAKQARNATYRQAGYQAARSLVPQYTGTGESAAAPTGTNQEDDSGLIKSIWGKTAGPVLGKVSDALGYTASKTVIPFSGMMYRTPVFWWGEELSDKISGGRLGVLSEDEEKRLKESINTPGLSYTDTYNQRFEGHPFAKLMYEMGSDPTNIIGAGAVGKLAKVPGLYTGSAKLLRSEERAATAWRGAARAEEWADRVQALPVTGTTKLIKKGVNKWVPEALQESARSRGKHYASMVRNAIGTKSPEEAGRILFENGYKAEEQTAERLARLPEDEFSSELDNLSDERLSRLWKTKESSEVITEDLYPMIHLKAVERGLINEAGDGLTAKAEALRKIDFAADVKQIGEAERNVMKGMATLFADMISRSGNQITAEQAYEQISTEMAFKMAPGTFRRLTSTETIEAGINPARVKGYYNLEDGKIFLMPNSDVTTFTHELFGHAYHFISSDTDRIMLLKRLGVDDQTIFNMLTTPTAGAGEFAQVYEKIADDVENFLQTGDLSSVAPEIQSLFGEYRALAGERYRRNPLPTMRENEAAASAEGMIARMNNDLDYATIPGPRQAELADVPYEPEFTNDWSTAVAEEFDDSFGDLSLHDMFNFSVLTPKTDKSIVNEGFMKSAGLDAGQAVRRNTDELDATLREQLQARGPVEINTPEIEYGSPTRFTPSLKLLDRWAAEINAGKNIPARVPRQIQDASIKSGIPIQFAGESIQDYAKRVLQATSRWTSGGAVPTRPMTQNALPDLARLRPNPPKTSAQLAKETARAAGSKAAKNMTLPANVRQPVLPGFGRPKVRFPKGAPTQTSIFNGEVVPPLRQPSLPPTPTPGAPTLSSTLKDVVGPIKLNKNSTIPANPSAVGAEVGKTLKVGGFNTRLVSRSAPQTLPDAPTVSNPLPTIPTPEKTADELWDELDEAGKSAIEKDIIERAYRGVDIPDTYANKALANAIVTLRKRTSRTTAEMADTIEKVLSENRGLKYELEHLPSSADDVVPAPKTASDASSLIENMNLSDQDKAILMSKLKNRASPGAKRARKYEHYTPFPNTDVMQDARDKYAKILEEGGELPEMADEVIEEVKRVISTEFRTPKARRDSENLKEKLFKGNRVMGKQSLTFKDLPALFNGNAIVNTDEDLMLAVWHLHTQGYLSKVGIMGQFSPTKVFKDELAKNQLGIVDDEADEIADLLDDSDEIDNILTQIEEDDVATLAASPIPSVRLTSLPADASIEDVVNRIGYQTGQVAGGAGEVWMTEQLGQVAKDYPELYRAASVTAPGAIDKLGESIRLYDAGDVEGAGKLLEEAMKEINITNFVFGGMHPVLKKLSTVVNAAIPQNRKARIPKATDIGGRRRTGSNRPEEELAAVERLVASDSVKLAYRNYNKKLTEVEQVATEVRAINSLSPVIDDQTTMSDIAKLRNMDGITVAQQKKIDGFLKLNGVGSIKNIDKRNIGKVTIETGRQENFLKTFEKEEVVRLGGKPFEMPSGAVGAALTLMKGWREQALLSPKRHLQDIGDIYVRTLINRIPLRRPRSAMRFAEKLGITPPADVYTKGSEAFDMAGLPDESVLGRMPGWLGKVGGGVSDFSKTLSRETENTARVSAWAHRTRTYMSESIGPAYRQELRRVLGDEAAERVYKDIELNEFEVSAVDISTRIRQVGGSEDAAAELGTIWNRGIAEASSEGSKLAKDNFFDYTMRTNIEEKFKFHYWLPFHYWATRNIPYYIETFAEHPNLMKLWDKYNRISEEYKEEGGLSAKMNGMMPLAIPIPFVETLFGANGAVYLNPFVMLSIADQLKGRHVPNDSTPAGELLTYAGMVGLAPAPWVSIPLTTLGVYGEDANASRLLRHSTIARDALNLLPGDQNYDIERPYVAGQRFFQEALWGDMPDPMTTDFYTDRALTARIAEMSIEETGQANHPDYIIAMADKESPIFKRAFEDIQRRNLVNSLIGFILPFPNTYVSDTEADIRLARKQLGEEYDGLIPSSVWQQKSNDVAMGYSSSGKGTDARMINAGYAMMNSGNPFYKLGNRQAAYTAFPEMALYSQWLNTRPKGFADRSVDAYLKSID